MWKKGRVKKASAHLTQNRYSVKTLSNIKIRLEKYNQIRYSICVYGNCSEDKTKLTDVGGIYKWQ